MDRIPEKNEPFVPNWEAIDLSAIWQEQVYPMLEQMYHDALEMKAAILGAPMVQNQNLPTLEEFHFWRGNCAAIKAIMELPQASINAKRTLTAQEKEDAFVTAREQRKYDARRSTA